MKLYGITETMQEINNLLESGELTQEELGDTIEALKGELEEKVKACLMVRQNKNAKAEAITAEINRLIELRSSYATESQKILDYVKAAMIKTKNDKLDLGLFKLTLRKATKKLGDIDESKVPNEFFKVVPETKKLDKRALLAAAKESAIDGVSVIDGERELTVK